MVEFLSYHLRGAAETRLGERITLNGWHEREPALPERREQLSW
jgi:hypothetical protein